MENLKTRSICSLMKIGDRLFDNENLKIERKAVKIFHVINTATEKIFEVCISNDSALEEIFMKDRVEVALTKIHALFTE